jgi:hypothetical protein
MLARSRRRPDSPKQEYQHESGGLAGSPSDVRPNDPVYKGSYTDDPRCSAGERKKEVPE